MLAVTKKRHVKKVDHLLIAETNEGLPPLLNDFAPLLSQFSEMPVSALPLEKVLQIHGHPAPQLQLLHTDLTSMHHLGQVIELCSAFPHSSIVIVSSKQDEQLCLLALEAGA